MLVLSSRITGETSYTSPLMKVQIGEKYSKRLSGHAVAVDTHIRVFFSKLIQVQIGEKYSKRLSGHAVAVDTHIRVFFFKVNSSSDWGKIFQATFRTRRGSGHSHSRFF